MQSFKNTFGPLFPIIIAGMIILLIFTLSRLGLSLWQFERIPNLTSWINVFSSGLRVDIATISYLFLLPLLLANRVAHFQGTPQNIDKLYQEGWGFTKIYATGTRSVRGIEAVTTGFSPTPARSVIKLGKSQSNFFSIARLLKDKQYHTQFTYGGESHFDNMKSFFLGNSLK